jgi:uncharacterized protein (TIGR03000 family)
VVTVAAPTAAPTLPAPAVEAAPANAATVIVKAPTDARVTVNGQATALAQEEQVFTTPSLDPNQNYVYIFKAEVTRDGKPVARTQRVRVRAGQEARVDFSELMRASRSEEVLTPYASR